MPLLHLRDPRGADLTFCGQERKAKGVTTDPSAVTCGLCLRRFSELPSLVAIGETVRHRLFGTGTVVASAPLTGELALVVNFASGGRKIISADEV